MSKQAIPGARRSNLFLVEPETLTIVGLDTDDGPDHPLYDPRIKLPIDEGLVRNIMTYGVIEPVTVTKNGDRIELVDGRQRVRHARVANERLVAEGKEPMRVPVSPPRRASDHVLFGVMISANENRQEDSPLAKADKLERYLAMGRTEEEAAVAFGVTLQAIKTWQCLSDLSPPVRKAIERGDISASAGAQLAPLPRDEQLPALEQLIGNGETTAREVRARVKSKQTGQGGVVAPKTRRVRKLIKALETGDADSLDVSSIESFKLALQWTVGDIGDDAVEGLTDLL